MPLLISGPATHHSSVPTPRPSVAAESKWAPRSLSLGRQHKHLVVDAQGSLWPFCCVLCTSLRKITVYLLGTVRSEVSHSKVLYQRSWIVTKVDICGFSVIKHGRAEQIELFPTMHFFAQLWVVTQMQHYNPLTLFPSLRKGCITYTWRLQSRWSTETSSHETVS